MKLSESAQRVLSDLSNGSWNLTGYMYPAGIMRYSMMNSRGTQYEYCPHPAMIARLIRLGYLTSAQSGNANRITEKGRIALKASRL